jgi:hypothetical protein
MPSADRADLRGLHRCAHILFQLRGMVAALYRDLEMHPQDVELSRHCSLDGFGQGYCLWPETINCVP